MNCPNCHARLSCGCQKRRASNGATVCSNCLGAYEAKLRAGGRPAPKKAQSGEVISVSASVSLES